ncbi:MAG: molecular chaperone DnaJ [Candidatus Marinimicrobia bacterium]|nr:molecular chaperone DnaJ [Candidatus Neomarinimicrobiota bacterium]
MKRDYYEILGVSKTSSQNEIKKAYRKVAMKYHPDKNPDDKQAEEKFKEAAEAYSILSNEDKKSRYDQFGHAGVNQSSSAGFSGGMDLNDIFSNFGDIFGGSGFGDFFGGSSGGFGGARNSRSQNDMKISIPLSLEEIFSGVSKKIKIKRWEKSSTSSAAKCNNCDGRGEVRHVQRSMLGQIVNVQVCSHCNGVGYIGGRDKNTATIKVKIPAGVSDGNYMTLNGEGNQSIDGGSNGDLIIYFEEKSHELFIRDGSDIYIECIINYCDAVLGNEIQVPTLSGKVKLKIPPGIKNGQLLRLKNKGIKEVNRHKVGNQYIRINIDIPTSISKIEKDVILKLRELTKDKVQFKKINN